MHTLYIVATPIGNLEDITLRALRVLKEVGLIAAEDTRVTRKLLGRYDITTPVTSYHEHNRKKKLPSILRALAESDVALVSDAGMPTINDPGQDLVRQANGAGAAVEVVPGASAVTAALAVSGIPAEQFVYLGFLPRKGADRRRLFQTFQEDPRTIVAFETPHRLTASLRDLQDTLGDRPIAVCRELTKLYGEVFRGTISGAREHFSAPKGEFTLVIGGHPGTGAGHDDKEPDALEMLKDLKSRGSYAGDAVAHVVEHTGMPRRRVYDLWLSIGDDSEPPPSR